MSALPAHLNPQSFEDAFDEFYLDEYEGHYNVTLGRHSFAIRTSLPLRIYLIEGVTGDEFGERHLLLPFLKIAQAMRSETGKWPEIHVEWALMCPGGLLLLDLSALASTNNAEPLPAVLSRVASHLDKMLSRREQDFSEAERHYRKELRGIAAFNEVMLAIQRDFDQEPLRIINTNTKVRRLRYLAVLGTLAARGTTQGRLNSQILSWAEKHAEELAAHSDARGAILSSTGPRSAAPYLDAARSMGIIAPAGRGLALTNSGRALLFLPTNSDRFDLTESERLYFLFDLLNYDRDILWPLLTLLRDQPAVSKATLREQFPQAYKDHLSRLRERCGTTRSRRHIEAALARSNQWQSAEKYMEHIVDPRVSWFVDLELCSMRGTDVSLLPKGKALADELLSLAEEGIFIVTLDFLRHWFFRVIARHITTVERPIETKIPGSTAIEVLRRCCDKIRRTTTSLAPNRVVASTLFRLVSIILFTEYSVAVDFADLHKLCSQPESANRLGWRLRWSVAQNDGYLMPVSPNGLTP